MQPFPAGAGKWQISTDGGSEPIWSADGREIYYRSLQRVLAVTITTKPSFALGARRVLFEGPYVDSSLGGYALRPDGKGFLMLRQQGVSSTAQINIVLDWAEELRNRLGDATKGAR